ncbi:MAG: hypothetical protein RLY40_900 [Pseudomonadota bacterium]|jgi:hypothetical protein
MEKRYAYSLQLNFWQAAVRNEQAECIFKYIRIAN